MPVDSFTKTVLMGMVVAVVFCGALFAKVMHDAVTEDERREEEAAAREWFAVNGAIAAFGVLVVLALLRALL